ncbi:MAG: dehydratase [Azospirillum sp.]|nr:dehydratase [Azospirillum sp.]
MTVSRYLEDFTPGQRFSAGSVTVDADAIIGFARAFDPQPFHTDPASAKGTFFQGLAASGWHTAAITMRLFVESRLGVPWGIIGREVEQIGWPRPTRPGDRLRIESEVIEVRRSRSRPEMGTVRVRTETFNQDDLVVQTMTAALVVPARDHVAA